jgi:protein TonB
MRQAEESPTLQETPRVGPEAGPAEPDAALPAEARAEETDSETPDTEAATSTEPRPAPQPAVGSTRGASRRRVWWVAAPALALLVTVAAVFVLTGTADEQVSGATLTPPKNDPLPEFNSEPAAPPLAQTIPMGPPEPDRGTPRAVDPVPADPAQPAIQTTKRTESAPSGAPQATGRTAPRGGEEAPATVTGAQPRQTETPVPPVRSVEVARAAPAPAEPPGAEQGPESGNGEPQAPETISATRPVPKAAGPEDGVAEAPPDSRGGISAVAAPAGESPVEGPAETPRASAAETAGIVAADGRDAETRSGSESVAPVEIAVTPLAAPEAAEPVRATPPRPGPVEPATPRGAPVELAEVDTRPGALERAPPDYPAIARRLQLEGAVTLRLLVNEDGSVGEVEPVSGRAGDPLVRSALRAARRWTYLPATKDGVPVKVWITERVVFRR